MPRQQLYRFGFFPMLLWIIVCIWLFYQDLGHIKYTHGGRHFYLHGILQFTQCVPSIKHMYFVNEWQTKLSSQRLFEIGAHFAVIMRERLPHIRESPRACPVITPVICKALKQKNDYHLQHGHTHQLIVDLRYIQEIVHVYYLNTTIMMR